MSFPNPLTSATRSRFLTISASTATPDYIVNRRVAWVQCPATNTAAVVINGEDEYGPGYNGPGSRLPLAGISGTNNDEITIVVELD